MSATGLASVEAGDPVHRLSPTHKWGYMAFAILAAAGVVVAAAAPWIWPGSFTALYLATPTAVLAGVASSVSLNSARWTEEAFRVEESGVVRIASDGDETLLPWNRIAQVRVRPLLQRLELVDRRNLPPFRLGFHLEGFEELAKTVSRQVFGSGSVHGPPLRVFHRGRLRGLILATAPLWLLISIQYLGGVLLAAWALFFTQVGVWAFGWHRIRVQRDGLILERPVFSRKIAAREIHEVELRVAKGSGNAAPPVVVLGLEDGEAVSIAGVREDSLRLFAELDSMAARNRPDRRQGGERVPGSVAARESR